MSLNLKSIKLLLIEKNRREADHLSEILTQKGRKEDAHAIYKLVHASTFEEATSSLEQDRYDIILLSLSNHNEKHAAFIHRVRALTGDIPIIFISDSAQESALADVIDKKARMSLLLKPINEESIKGAIDDIFDAQNAIRELQTPKGQLDILQVFYEIAAAGKEASDEDLLLEKITTILGELYPLDNYGFMFLEEVDGILHHHPSYHFEEKRDRQNYTRLGEGICGSVAQTGAPLRIPSVSDNGPYLGLDLDIRAVLCVPLKIGGHVIGVINAESRQPNAFSEADEQLLTTLASHLGAILEKNRLIAAKRGQRLLAETLTRLGLALTSTLDLPDLLNIICQESLELFNVDSAYIGLVQDKVLRGFAGFGAGTEEFLKIRTMVDDPKSLGAHVIREKRTLFVNNAPKSDMINQNLVQRFHVKAVLGVPLIDGKKAIGALMLLNTHEAHAFSEVDADTAQFLGNLASIAIKNARLFEAERSRRREAEILRDATEGISASLELRHVLNQILIYLEQIVPYESACIFLKDGDRFEAAAGRNFPDLEKVLGHDYLLSEDPLSLEVQNKGSPMIIEDVQKDPRFKFWGGTDYVRGWMIVPLMVRGKIIGTLTIDSREPGAFGESDAALAQAIGIQAALAIDNARLFQETQRQALELVGLYETALTISSVLVTDALFARLKEQIQRLLNPDSFGLFLYEAESDQIIIGFAIEDGKDLPGIVNNRIAVKEGGLTGWVIQTRTPLLIDDIENDQLPIDPHHLTKPARAWLGVPLIARDRLIGAITLQSYRPNAFTHSDTRFLESLAAQIAIALENAKLFEEAQLGMVRQESLNAIVSSVSGSVTPISLLETALHHTLIALGLQSGGIWIGEICQVCDLPQDLFEKMFDSARATKIDLMSLMETIPIEDWGQLDSDHPLANMSTWATGKGIHAALLAPVQVNGESSGGLILIDQARRNWQREEITLVETIGRQIGSALEKLQVQTQKQARAELMKRLVPISEALNRPFTIAKVVEEIGNGAITLSGTNRAAVFLRHPDDRVTCPWFDGLSTAYIDQMTKFAKHIPGGNLLDSPEPIFFPNINHIPNESPLKILALKEEYKAFSLWPLLYEGRVIAAVGCYYDHEHHWTTPEREVFLGFTRQAAIALENAGLFEAVQAHAEKLTGLLETSRDISTALEVDELLGLITERVIQLTGADKSLTLLFDTQAERLFKVVGKGFEQDQLDNFSFAELRDGISGWVLSSKQPTISSDLFLDERNRGIAQEKVKKEKDPGKSLAVAPLLIKGEVVGTLTIINNQTKPIFTQSDLDFVVMLASQAAVALENARLFEAIRNQAQRQIALLRLSTELATPMGERETCLAIVTGLHDTLGFDNLGLFLVDEMTEERVLVASMGWPNSPEEWRIPPGEGISERPLLDGKLHYTPDVTLDPLYLPGLPTGSEVDLPLRIGEKIAGVLIVQKTQPHSFSEDEFDLLTVAANHASLAIGRARLLESERRRSEEFEALGQASLQLTSSLELELVLQAILKQTLKLVSADDAHIFLYDGDHLQFGAAMTPNGYITKPIDEPREHGITYLVAQKGERIIVTDANKDPLYHDRPWNGAIVGLPLSIGDEVLGVMNIAFNHPHNFDKNELRILGLLADQAAIGLENARLFTAQQARVDELTAIAEVSGVLREAANVQEISQILAVQALRLVQADLAILYLNNESQSQLVAHGIAEASDRVDISTEKSTQAHDVATPPEVDHIKLLRTRNLMVFRWEILAELGLGICLPLRISTGEALGMMIVARKSSPEGNSLPFGPEEERLLGTLSEIAANALQRAQSHEELEGAYLQTVLSLAKAMDARDTYTSDHSQRLAQWTEATAKELGCKDSDIQAIRWAALLHDIGKIGVPDQILLKPDLLTEDEWRIMKRHPETGADIVAPVKKLSHVAPLIRAHQEKFDGTGYPDGLKGEEIPFGARILAVADAYIAITDERVYRKARSHEQAIAEIQRCSGKQFDPAIVEAFLKVVGRRPPDP